MDNKSPISGDRLRTNWTPSMDHYFIDLVLEQVHKGNMTDNACRKQIWMHMISLFNAKFGSQYDKDVLRNRYKTMRRQYNDIKTLLDQDGFSWDENRQMILAEDTVWDHFIKAHPDLRSYRTKIVPHYNDMCVIYGNTTADGVSTNSNYSIELEDDTLEAKISGASEDLQSSPWYVAHEEKDNVEEDSSLPSGNIVWDIIEGGAMDILTDRAATVPLITNKTEDENVSILVSNGQEDLPIGDIMVQGTDERMADAFVERAVPVSSLENDKVNECFVEVHSVSSHLDMEMVRGSTMDGVVSSLSERLGAASQLANKNENEIFVLVSHESSHTCEDMMKGSMKQDLLDAVPLVGHGKKENDCSFLVKDMQDNSSHFVDGMIMESTKGRTADSLSDSKVTDSSLANKKKDTSSYMPVLQEDSSHLGEDMIKESAVTVDAFSEAMARASVLLLGKKRNNESIDTVDNVLEELSQSSGDVMEGRTDEGVEDSLYEVGIVFAPLTKVKTGNNSCIPVNNVQDASYVEWDMQKKKANESTVDTHFEMEIEVSSRDNEENNSSNQSLSTISSLQSTPNTSFAVDNNRSRVTWTPTMDRYFINLMLDHVCRGNKIGRSFSKQAWMDMMTLFNRKFAFQYDKDVLKNRYKTLRRQYIDIISLLGHNGFSWNKTLQMVTADVHCWDNYIKAHPNARQYRTRPMPYFDDLCMIYGNAEVKGKFPSSDRCVNRDDDVSEVKLGVSRGLDSPATSVKQKDLVDDVLEFSPLGVGEDVNVSGQENKRKYISPATAQLLKKPRSTDEGVINALHEMATVVTSLADKKNDHDGCISIENVVGAIQAIPDIDEDLLLDACDFLEDERKARTFLALDVRLRKKWLTRKLRPYTP